MNPAPSLPTSQPPRLLDQFRAAARRFGHPEPTVEVFAAWVVRFIFFHHLRHPRDLGLAEVGSFLQQVARTAADPVAAIDNARAGLEFLYREVLAQPLGELPRPRPPRLLDQVRQVLRVGHYSFRTEEAYAHWIRRFIFYHGTRHPRQLGAAEVEQFLTHLAVEGRVSASTQNQALAALLFLYGRVLEIDLGRLDAVRAHRRKPLPVVLLLADATPEAIRAAVATARPELVPA